MPFDGNEFSRSPDPLPPGAPAVVAPHEPRPWPARAWTGLRARLLPGPARVARRLPGAASLLREARALIEAEEDWTRGSYRTPAGRRCAMGALRAAARGWWSEHGLSARQEAHRRLLAVARGRGFDSVERMNDASTHAEVLAAFDAAQRSSTPPARGR